MRDPALQTATGTREDAAVARDILVRLLVTQAERDAMQTAADEAGVPLSEWIRQCCLETTTTIKPRTLKPKKGRRP